jgi:mRNA interferase MazF
MAYVPDAGHVVWLEFDPLAGHEQAGRRPALVVSPAHYDEIRSRGATGGAAGADL